MKNIGKEYDIIIEQNIKKIINNYPKIVLIVLK